MSLFIPARELKGTHGCVQSLAASTTLCLTEARNKGKCHWTLAEGGFLLLALASLVEAVVRVVLGLVFSAIFLAMTPVLIIMDGFEVTCCKTLPQDIPILFWTFAYTGVRTACNTLTDMVALVRNLTYETLDYDKDLLLCSAEPAKLPEVEQQSQIKGEKHESN